MASLYGHKDIAELLIEHGADPNATDEKGATSLHIAASAARREFVVLLIGRGADINAMDKKGTTPLDWAVIERDRHLSLVNTKWGDLHRVRLGEQRDVVDLLRKHGGKTGKELEAGESPRKR